MLEDEFVKELKIFNASKPDERKKTCDQILNDFSKQLNESKKKLFFHKLDGKEKGHSLVQCFLSLGDVEGQKKINQIYCYTRKERKEDTH